ncbi:MAG: isoleucine--tRNA ligase [Actinomycetota bacterium]
MNTPRYRPVDPQVSLPEMEQRVASFWRSERIFERSLSEREGAPEWVFYEGPPTANGRPGFHHAEARIFKDIFCRYQTMRGRYVHRKAGWDCHGLPVEIQVEKELGITRKRQIEEEIGIEEFARRCRESVQRYVEEWERFTDRIGFWIDLSDAYWTMSPQYIETVWWLLKQIWDKGLLEEDFKVVPYCPRCETALSSHEQHYAGAYKTVSDPSVYVRFPLEDEPDTSLLVWTTTPWTLLSNMGAAVGPELDYVKVHDPKGEGALILGKERVGTLLGDDLEVLAEMRGRDLVDRRYRPPYPYVESGETGHRVRPADFVLTAEGTGIVHLAPYGEDDMTIAKRDALPIVQMIDGSGLVSERADPPLAGMWLKDADPAIVEDLDSRGLLWASERYEHAYPHCWRCATPLIYYARKDWYIRTSQIQPDLRASNDDTNWQPPTVKYGRFGDWLANNVDWSLSRDRYWGTPLPVWRCEDDHATCVGSFAELSELAGRDLSNIDPHRPYIDEVVVACPVCGKQATRVRSVIDTWFDSGAMPFAQWHYPFENEEVFGRRFPADFISEAIDQTRGWFYTLLAIATLVRGHNSYRNVVCLGLLVDAEGRKMSKSLGNVINPWEVLEEQGADAMRWWTLASGAPWSARRVSKGIIQEGLRKYLLTLWNTYSFWVTYASLEGFDPGGETIAVAERPEMDRWILAELDDTVRVVTEGLDTLDATTGGRRLDRFVDDLSNWYVRRSRRRFWRSKTEAETRAAFLTLWECLVTLTKLTAPYTPYIADEIFTNIAAGRNGEPDSVHLAMWPEPEGVRVDDVLRRRMALVRRLVGLGRAARTDAKVRVRQPLKRALVVLPSVDAEDLAALEDLLAEEINVKEIEIASGVGELVSYTIKPNFAMLGPRFGPKVGALAGALKKADASALVAQLDESGAVELEVDGERVSLGRDDLDVRVEGKAGFALAQDGPHGIALDLELTSELKAEGVAREVVRAVQDLRKASGLAVEDRIQLWLYSTDETVRGALQDQSSYIGGETLATNVRLEAPSSNLSTTELAHDGSVVQIGLGRTAS